MGDREKKINAVLEQNVQEAMANDFRLAYRASPNAGIVVLARDPGTKRLLLGGLGGVGVGRMWVAEEPGMAKYVGYDDAPIADAPPDQKPW